MRIKYAQKLVDELKIRSSTPDEPSSAEHTFECLLCGESFKGTPKDKVSKFKKHNKAGCPKCVRVERYASNTENTISKMYDMGFELLGVYRGADVPVLLRKIDCCGRSWESRPHNIVLKNPSCKPCRDDKAALKYDAEQERLEHVGKMKPHYLNHLIDDIKLKVLTPIKTSNDHHDIECMLCATVFTATPKSKVRGYKINGIPGCPSCSIVEKYSEASDYNTTKLADMGFKLIEEYTTRYSDIEMANINCCGRTFTATPHNVLNGASICPPCNDDRKRMAFQDFNIERHETALEHMEGFQKYSKKARVLTEQTYRDNINTINPSNLPRMRSGQDGYHLDHIYSIYRCYHDGIPEDICAHPDNLQMLEWHINAVKYNKAPDVVPNIVVEYLTNP